MPTLSLQEIEIELAAIRAEREQIVTDAKTKLTRLDGAEQVVMNLRAHLLKLQAAQQTRGLIEAQSSCRPISLLF